MDVPVLFQSAVDIFSHTFKLEQHGWTTPLERYYFAVYREPRSGRVSFCKMTDPTEVDLDDENRRTGLQRVVWFYNVLAALRQRGEVSLPFWTPTVHYENVTNDHNSQYSYVTMRYLEDGPICNMLPGQGTDMANFRRLCEAMADCHHTLQQITPITVGCADPRLIFPPTLPHETLGGWNKVLVELLRRSPNKFHDFWRERLAVLQAKTRLNIEHHPKDFVLDPGSFEPKNFFKPGRDGISAEVIDTEFAGWSLRQHTLAKAFIRLWANAQRPDLAKMLLRTYVEKFRIQLDSEFYDDFFRELRQMIKWGNFFDTVRRRHISRSFPTHVLRRELKQIIQGRRYVDLLT